MDAGVLQARIDYQPAFTLRVEAARADEVELHPHWQDMSIAWAKQPDGYELALWIDDCLPENGSRDPYGARAGAAMIEHGVRGTAGASPLLAWANPDAEFPGAVTFHSICSATTHTPTYEALSDIEIGDRLHEAWRTANRAHKGGPAKYPERRTSLSGMRGKMGLALINGKWHGAYGSALSTWIAKTRGRGTAERRSWNREPVPGSHAGARGTDRTDAIAHVPRPAVRAERASRSGNRPPHRSRECHPPGRIRPGERLAGRTEI